MATSRGSGDQVSLGGLDWSAGREKAAQLSGRARPRALTPIPATRPQNPLALHPRDIVSQDGGPGQGKGEKQYFLKSIYRHHTTGSDVPFNQRLIHVTA